MGIAQSMKENMQQNMKNQMVFQKELILKQRQAQLATQIAMGRQRFKYYSYFAYTFCSLLVIGSIKNKNPALLGPLIPIGFAYAYQYDMFYGDMLERVQVAADELIVEHPYKFFLPKHSGIVSQEQYEKTLQIFNGKRIV